MLLMLLMLSEVIWIGDICRAAAAPPTSESAACFREKLAGLVKNKNLGDINYQNVSTRDGHFIGTVTISKTKFSSYPEEFSKIDDAYEFAARDAYKQLESTTLGSELPVSSDPKLITQRVIDIVGTEATGYWSQSLIEKYAKDFNERLPANWVQIVSQVTNSITFEPVAEHFLVCPRTHHNLKNTTEKKVTNLKDSGAIDSSLFTEQLEPIPASLPESGTLLVHVLVVHAADRVSSTTFQYFKSTNLMNFRKYLCHNYIQLILMFGLVAKT